MWFNLLTLCASKKGKSREEGGMSSLCFGVTIYVCVAEYMCLPMAKGKTCNVRIDVLGMDRKFEHEMG